MTYKVVNQYGKFIDGEHRSKIIDGYLHDKEEIFFEDGFATIEEVAKTDDGTIIHIKIEVR